VAEVLDLYQMQGHKGESGKRGKKEPKAGEDDPL
jgi:hypothetical protein